MIEPDVDYFWDQKMHGWRAPKPLGRFKLNLSMETSEKVGVSGHAPSFQHFRGVEGHVGAPGWD
jgi:hypothetical protein